MNIVPPEANSALLSLPYRNVNQMWQILSYAGTTEDHKIEKNNL